MNSTFPVSTSIVPTDLSNSFPTKNQTLSLMKNLILSAISTIAYTRELWPRNTNNLYKTRTMAGCEIFQLQKDVLPEVDAVLTWINGSFDALQKNYLSSIVLGIKPRNSESVDFIESWQFQFEFNDENHLMIENENLIKLPKLTKDTIRESTSAFLKEIIESSKNNDLPKIPESRAIQMKIFYHKDITPDDYLPKNFKESTLSIPWSFQNQPTFINHIPIMSEFYQMKTKLKYCKQNYGKLVITRKNLLKVGKKRSHDEQHDEELCLFSQELDSQNNMNTVNNNVDNKINKSNDDSIIEEIKDEKLIHNESESLPEKEKYESKKVLSPKKHNTRNSRKNKRFKQMK